MADSHRMSCTECGQVSKMNEVVSQARQHVCPDCGQDCSEPDSCFEKNCPEEKPQGGGKGRKRRA